MLDPFINPYASAVCAHTCIIPPELSCSLFFQGANIHIEVWHQNTANTFTPFERVDVLDYNFTSPVDGQTTQVTMRGQRVNSPKTGYVAIHVHLKQRTGMIGYPKQGS